MFIKMFNRHRARTFRCLRSLPARLAFAGMPSPTNVLGGPLQSCCTNPMTGFYRDGFCRTGPGDQGLHTVCVRVTWDFLEFSAARGNDLSSPRPEFAFPGLKEGDCWCLCVERWQEAFEADCAPPVVLDACHVSALEFVDLADLQAHAVEPGPEPRD